MPGLRDQKRRDAPEIPHPCKSRVGHPQSKRHRLEWLCYSTVSRSRGESGMRGDGAEASDRILSLLECVLLL